ncbi:hypothetical protein ACGFNY_45305 [Streptomyces chartreusis]|uniref:hypothetical protein n=1 Tax=Streptomyces chartreusis TaxID=1969 RepID=UPI003719B96F
MSTATTTAPQTWTTPHQLTVLHQHQESTVDGVWKSRRHTGLSLLVCNCGHSTGWVATEDLDMDQVKREHGQAEPMGTPFVP